MKSFFTCNKSSHETVSENTSRVDLRNFSVSGYEISEVSLVTQSNCDEFKLKTYFSQENFA